MLILFVKVTNHRKNNLLNKQDKKTIDVLHGGICRESQRFFKHKGFENVYQLEDGIIEYTPSKS
jgi:predicted sulfurtransferase